MLDGRGFVAETNATHLFVVTGGQVLTPFTHACPEGITRAAVLRLAAEHGIEHRTADLSPAQMYTADEVFCTGTMGEIAAITSIDGRSIGGADVGPLTLRMAKLYRDHARAAGVALDL